MATIVPKEDLIREYVEKDVSQGDAAKTLGCSRTQLQRALTFHGLPSKPKNSPTWHHGRKTSYPQLADKAWLEEKLKTMTQNEIAILLGTTSGNVADFVKRHGLRAENYDRHQAIYAGQEKKNSLGRFKNGAYEGRYKRRGYIMILVPDHPYAVGSGYVAEHRLAMEKALGRYLLPTEVVHHKDRNKRNNDLSNLELMSSRAEHGRLHARENLEALVEVERLNLEIADMKKRLSLTERKQRRISRRISSLVTDNQLRMFEEHT